MTENNEQSQRKIARFEVYPDRAALYCYNVPEQRMGVPVLGIRVPEPRCIARFVAYDGGACLYCERNPFSEGIENGEAI